MKSSYSAIKDINSLQSIHDYIKGRPDKSKIYLFLDFDDCLVNPDTNRIIEPKVTKDLFKYLIDNEIYFAVITGRFWDTVCDDKKRNLVEMQHNIVTTMYPALLELGMDLGDCLTLECMKKFNKIYNDKGECVGILYMGIFFTGQKGATIKSYIENYGLPHSEILFVDDYEPYLKETTTSYPKVKAFRRNVPYLPSY
jgi:hypothetical protein